MKKVLLLAGLVAAVALLWTLRLIRADAVDAAPPPGNASVAAVAFPLRVELPSGEELTLAAPPRRILPANAAVVDFLRVLVRPERVVALPAAAGEYSSLAAHRKLREWHELPVFTGYRGETVLAFEPDLVLAHAWQSPETTAVLRQSGVPVLVTPLPSRWSEIVATLELLGRLLDAEAEAAQTVADLERRMQALQESAWAGTGLTALSYSNLGVGGTAAGSGTTADILFELTGLVNAATAGGLSGHASIDHERLLALDPDLIVVGLVADDGETPPSKDYLLRQADLAHLEAIREDRIVALPPRLFTTASLELLDAAERLAAEVDRLFDR